MGIWCKSTDLLEGVGIGLTMGGTPAGDGAHGPLVVLGSGPGESNSAHMGAHGSVSLKLQQTDVVQNVERVVVLMEDDPGDLDVLLVSVHGVQLVGADSHAQRAGRQSNYIYAF